MLQACDCDRRDPYLSVRSLTGSEMAGAATVPGPSWSGSEVLETPASLVPALAVTWVAGTPQDLLAPNPLPPAGHPSTLQQTEMLVGERDVRS